MHIFYFHKYNRLITYVGQQMNKKKRMVAYRKGNTEQLDAKRRKWSVFVLFSAIFICLVSKGIGGCGWKKTGVEKLRDLDYTVVGEAELPGELKTEIEARKAEDFKMTYLLDDALYIVHGFGMQETGGYSIQVQALYLAENAIYFETDLIGPEWCQSGKMCQLSVYCGKDGKTDRKCSIRIGNGSGCKYGAENRKSLYRREKRTGNNTADV